MDKDLFVKNVQMICVQKGIRPTNACKESGVGGSFLSDIKNRGSIPSVAKVQMLAEYLGVTVSELLGETISSGTASCGPDILVKFQQLTPENQKEVLAFIEFKHGQQSKEPPRGD